MSTPSWLTVKPKVARAIEDTKEKLTTCAPEDLLRLQARVAALSDLSDFFEEGDPDARKISDPGGY